MSNLAYLKVVALEGGAFAGGVMVTDPRGLPLDFRYTDPVKPDKLQHVLYGKSLERHVRQDVLFKHLTEKLEHKPAYLLVDDEHLLGLSAAAPIVFVAETRMPPLKEVAERQGSSEAEFLLQVTDSGSPLRVRLGKPEPGAAEAVAGVLLESARQGLDPTEPFGRVKVAVEMLCREGSDDDAA